MKRIILIVLMVMLNVSRLTAFNPGSTGANFLKINLAPRELAMGSVGIGFSVYTLMGAGFYDLSEAYAYPVPYKPNDGLSITGDATSGITFTNLSTEADIEIYTIAGELVKKLIHKGGFVKEWYPVENEKGKKVVSGVYIYYIKNDKEHKSGKIVIIR